MQHRFVEVPEEEQRVGADVSMIVALGTILLPLHHLQTVAREDGQGSLSTVQQDALAIIAPIHRQPAMAMPVHHPGAMLADEA